jgi:hypothetical protein
MLTQSVDTENHLDQGAVPRSINDRTLYILVIGAGAPTRPKVEFTNRYGRFKG